MRQRRGREYRCLVCGFVGPERHVHRHDLRDPTTAYSCDESSAAMRGFAYWLLFMGAMFVVTLVLAWVFA